MIRFVIFALLSTSIFGHFDSTIPALHLPDYFDSEKKEDFLNQLEAASRDVGFFCTDRNRS